MLFPDSKVEIKIASYKDQTMATLIARRMHFFANDKNSEFRKLGFRFLTSTDDKKSALYLSSTKLRALDDGTVHLMEQLAKTYQAILQPFFSKR